MVKCIMHIPITMMENQLLVVCFVRRYSVVEENECLCSIPNLTNEVICKTCGIYLGIEDYKQDQGSDILNLTIPVMHTSFYKTTPNIIAELLDMDVETIQDIISCRLHVIICCYNMF